MPSWIWSPKHNSLIPKPTRGETSQGMVIHRAPEAFVSPVDGTLIDDRGKLREHNKRHGVTDVRDYGDDWFKRRGVEKHAEMTGATPEAKKERIELIKHVLDHYSRGDK